MRDSDTAGRELAREARQQSRRASKFLSHFYGPKRNRRSVKFASKRSVSVYRGFPSRCTLNCNRIDPAAKKKDRERLIADLTIARRKLQLKCEFCFVFQPSFADKFYVSWAFFLHEQRVSLRLALSVLSDIIISRNELSFYFISFFLYLFIYSIFTALVLYQKSNFT